MTSLFGGARLLQRLLNASDEVGFLVFAFADDTALSEPRDQRHCVHLSELQRDQLHFMKSRDSLESNKRMRGRSNLVGRSESRNVHILLHLGLGSRFLRRNASSVLRLKTRFVHFMRNVYFHVHVHRMYKMMHSEPPLSSSFPSHSLMTSLSSDWQVVAECLGCSALYLRA